MSVKVLGVCGSPIKGGNTEVFLAQALKAAEESGDVETELIALAGKDIRDCRHCNWCIRKQEEGKFCAQQDDMQEIFPKVLEANAYIFASPVYIARLSGYMANFLDRFRAFGHGNYYHEALTDRVCGALAVGWYRNTGGETTLLSLIGGSMTFGMVPVTPNLRPGVSEFGVVGLASEHGTGRFDPKDRLGILQDEVGLAAARELGKRVADVARLIKAGKQALSGAAVKG